MKKEFKFNDSLHVSFTINSIDETDAFASDIEIKDLAGNSIDIATLTSWEQTEIEKKCDQTALSLSYDAWFEGEIMRGSKET